MNTLFTLTALTAIVLFYTFYDSFTFSETLRYVFDMGYNSGGNAKSAPLTFGVVKSKLFTQTLAKPHHKAALTPVELRALKCWVDLNCPLWPDYQYRYDRPAKRVKVTQSR